MFNSQNLIKINLGSLSLQESYQYESELLKFYFHSILNHYLNDVSPNTLELSLKFPNKIDQWLLKQHAFIQKSCRFKSLLYWYICESTLDLNEELLIFLLRHNFEFNHQNSHLKIDDFLFKNKLIDKIRFLIDKFSYRFSSSIFQHLVLYAQHLEESDPFRDFVLFNIEEYSKENETRFTIAIKSNQKAFYKKLLEENSTDIMKKGKSGSPLELIFLPQYFDVSLIDLTIGCIAKEIQSSCSMIDYSFFWPQSLRFFSEKNLYDLITQTSFSELPFHQLMIDAKTHLFAYSLDQEFGHLLSFLIAKFKHEFDLSTKIIHEQSLKTITEISIEHTNLSISIIELLLNNNLLDSSIQNFDKIALKIFKNKDRAYHFDLESYLSSSFEKNEFKPIFDYLHYHKISLNELSKICNVENIVSEALQKDLTILLKFFILNFKDDLLLSPETIVQITANAINNSDNEFLTIIIENVSLNKNIYIEGLSLLAIAIIRENFNAFELLVAHNLVTKYPFQEHKQSLTGFIIESNAEHIFNQKENPFLKKILPQIISELLSEKENGQLLFEKLLEKRNPCKDLAKKTFDIFFNKIAKNEHLLFADRIPQCINLGLKNKVITPNRQISSQKKCIDYMIENGSCSQITDMINLCGEFFPKIKIQSHEIWINLLKKDLSGISFIEILQKINTHFKPTNLLPIIDHYLSFGSLHHFELILNHLDSTNSFLLSFFYQFLEKLLLAPNNYVDTIEKIHFLWKKKSIQEHDKWLKTTNKKHLFTAQLEQLHLMPTQSDKKSSVTNTQAVAEEEIAHDQDFSAIVRNSLNNTGPFLKIANIHPYEPLNIHLINVIKREILSEYFNNNCLLIKKVFNQTLFRQVIQNEIFHLLDCCIARQLNNSFKGILELFKKKYLENIHLYLTQLVVKKGTTDEQKFIILEILQFHQLITMELLHLIKESIDLNSYPITHEFLYQHHSSIIDEPDSPKTIYIKNIFKCIDEERTNDELAFWLNQLKEFPDPFDTASTILKKVLATTNEKLILKTIKNDYYLTACLFENDNTLLEFILNGTFSETLKESIKMIPLVQDALGLSAFTFVESDPLIIPNYNEDPLLFYFETGSFIINPKTGNYFINEIKETLLSTFLSLIYDENNPILLIEWLTEQKTVLKYLGVEYLFQRLIDANNQRITQSFLSLLNPIERYSIFNFCLHAPINHKIAESVICYLLKDIDLADLISSNPEQIIISLIIGGYYNGVDCLIKHPHLKKVCLNIKENCFTHFFGAISENKLKIANLLFQSFHENFENETEVLNKFIKEATPYVKDQAIRIMHEKTSCQKLNKILESHSSRNQKTSILSEAKQKSIVFSKKIQEQKGNSIKKEK